MRQINRNRNRGFTLLELLAVIAIAGIILFFAFRNRDAADMGTQTIGLIGQVQSLNDSVKRAYKHHRYTGLTTATAISSRQMPKEMVQGSGASATLQHDFGQGVALAAANCNGGTANCFTSTWSDIPGDACIGVLSSIEQQSEQIVVASTTVKALNGNFDRTAAITACDSATVDLVLTEI